MSHPLFLIFSLVDPFKPQLVTQERKKEKKNKLWILSVIQDFHLFATVPKPIIEHTQHPRINQSLAVLGGRELRVCSGHGITIAHVGIPVHNHKRSVTERRSHLS